jgi:hypothetical protein
MQAYRPLISRLSPPVAPGAEGQHGALPNGSAAPMEEDGEAEEGELEEGEAPKEEGNAAADPLPAPQAGEAAAALFPPVSYLMCWDQPCKSLQRMQNVTPAAVRSTLDMLHGCCFTIRFNLAAGPPPVVANGEAPRGELVTAAAGPGPGSAGQDAGGLTWDAAVADVRETLPADVWRVLSPEFLLAFWALSYQDVFVPAERCAPFG